MGERDKSKESYRAARGVVDGIIAGLQNQDLRSSLEDFNMIREVYKNS